MALYRKLIPKIAKDVIRSLLAKEAIEVDESQIGEAELDLAAVLVGYLDTLEEISREAKEALSRRGLSMDKYTQTKAKFAELKGIKTGEEELDFIIDQLIEALFASKNIEEIYAEDKDIRVTLKSCIEKAMGVSKEVEEEARARLKNIKEGTPEWDVEFPRMIALVRRQKGLN